MAAKKKKVPEKNDAGNPRKKRSLQDGAEEVERVDLAKYQVLFESVPHGITISDKAGNIVESNRMAEQLLGLPKKDQMSRQIDGREWHIIRPDGSPMPADEYASVRALKENCLVSNVEMGLVKGEGDITWIDVTAAPIPLEGYGVVIAYSDITKRKQAEEALCKSERELKSLFKSMINAFVLFESVFDDDGNFVSFRFVFINDAYERITGVKNDEVRGKTVHEVWPGTEASWIKAYGEVAVTGVPSTFEMYHEPTGKLYHCNVYCPGECRDRFCVIFEDITERKKAEEARRTFVEDLERIVIERTSDLGDINEKLMKEIAIRLDAEKQLTKTVGEKEVLLREVHHRVKNNLQIIISLLNLQSRFITDETTLSAFRESQNRIKAMALVHEKLYQSTDISQMDLDNYIRFLGNNLFQFLGMKGKGITFTRDIRDISLAIDTAIPLGLIINELVSNSLKYAFPEGRKGEISIAIHRQDHTLTILYKDNGVGIPQDLDWRNTKSLGLRLVISLVEQLSGTIELDRTAGTVFNIVVKEKQ